MLQLWEGSYLSRTAQSFYDWGVIAKHFEAMRLLGELQDTMKPLPSIDGQLSLMTAGAEERKPSAFTFSQEIIDAVLTRGSGISEGKMRIYEQFKKSLSAKENADFLKNEYGWGGVYPAIVGAGVDEQHDGKGIRISKGIGSDKLLELRERLKEYTGFDYSVIPESIVEAFIERIWVSKDEFRWYLRTGNNADGEFDPDDHIKIGAFTLTIDDAKKYIYSFSTRRRVYKWADLNVSVWI